MMELWDVYTREKRPTGRTAVRGEPMAPGDYHLVVVSLVFNGSNELLMTRRSGQKPLAGKWETTAGSVLAGERSADAMRRELEEEIGVRLRVDDSDRIHTFLYDEGIFDVYLFRSDIRLEDTTLQASEVDDIRYVGYAEFAGMFARGAVIPNLAVIMDLKTSGLIAFD